MVRTVRGWKCNKSKLIGWRTSQSGRPDDRLAAQATPVVPLSPQGRGGSEASESNSTVRTPSSCPSPLWGEGTERASCDYRRLRSEVDIFYTLTLADRGSDLLICFGEPTRGHRASRPYPTLAKLRPARPRRINTTRSKAQAVGRPTTCSRKVQSSETNPHG
jgi:hypothetical protein